jgi:hypothetical protein
MRGEGGPGLGGRQGLEHVGGEGRADRLHVVGKRPASHLARKRHPTALRACKVEAAWRAGVSLTAINDNPR